MNDINKNTLVEVETRKYSEPAESLTWTTEFPTKPGFYWIRNYRIMASMGVISRTEWTMAHVATGGIFQLWQWLDASRSQDIISAEWQGPIYPND